MKLARTLLAGMILLIVIHTANAFEPESIVIYENPTDNDFIKIYTTKSDVSPLLETLGIQVKKIEADRKDNYTIFTVHTSLSEKIGVFERKISGKVLKDISSISKVYIYIDKGVHS